VRLGLKLGIDVHPLFIPGNAMVHSARNEIVQQFLQTDFDDLVFIDADISWIPEDFFKLLNHQVDVVGATYPYKKNELQFVMKTSDGKAPVLMDNGLMRVQGLGMGFFRLTRAAVQSLWDSSMPYKRSGTTQEFRAVFEFTFQNGEETGEDITMCMKCPDVFLDPSIVLEHSGDRQHWGSPIDWLEAVKVEAERVAALTDEERAEEANQGPRVAMR
jgi:glycosyltransferase involved in cell wall biosynthesis